MGYRFARASGRKLHLVQKLINGFKVFVVDQGVAPPLFSHSKLAGRSAAPP